jgi:hypothetical protein
VAAGDDEKQPDDGSEWISGDAKGSEDAEDDDASGWKFLHGPGVIEHLNNTHA